MRPFVGDFKSSESDPLSGPVYGRKLPSPGIMRRSSSGSDAGADRGRQQK